MEPVPGLGAAPPGEQGSLVQMRTDGASPGRGERAIGVALPVEMAEPTTKRVTRRAGGTIDYSVASAWGDRNRSPAKNGKNSRQGERDRTGSPFRIPRCKPWSSMVHATDYELPLVLFCPPLGVLVDRRARPGETKMAVYALSIKQPWAGLLVHGRKTIEVRSWSTPRRGRVLVHAARVPDARAEGWNRVTEDLRVACSQVGGIIGCAELTDCRAYRNRQEFEADTERHLNDPSWYDDSLYGFVFANGTPLPFRALSGWMRFFPVEDSETTTGS